jgi:hypothetical protein
MLDVRWIKDSLSVVLTLFLFSSLFIAGACTRATDANNSVVSVAIPSAKNVSGKIETFDVVETPAHIVVKISGSGMSPVNYIWDGHGAAAAPVISLTVPQGPARLIQVLYVTQDPAQTLYFYYNDVTQDFTSANVSVAMTVNSLSASASQGQFIGRYIDAAGSGPTGILSTVFQPPGGKPVMVVDKNEIFGGWFSAFGLSNQAFSYVFEDGTVLLKDFTTSAAAINGMATALISVPSAYRRFFGNSSSENSGALNIVTGFFGPGASGKKVCVNPSNTTPIPNLFTDLAATTAALFNGSGTCSNPTTQACLIAGGAATTPLWTSASCRNSDNLNYMNFPSGQLANKDSALLFKGPFALTATGFGTSELVGNLSGSNLNLKWAYNTGATKGVEAVEVFYKWVSSGSNGKPEYSKDNGYDCNRLVSSYGFSSGGRIPVAQTSVSGINVGSSPAAGQSLVALLCPLNSSRSPIYFSSAVRWDGYNNKRRMALTPVSGSDATLAVNECKHFELKTLNEDGSPYFSSSAQTIKLSFKNPTFSLYGGFTTAVACTQTSQTMNFVIPAGSNKVDVYFTSAQANYFLIRAHSDGQSYIDLIKPITVATTSPNATNIFLRAPGSPPVLASGKCYPMEARLENSGLPATTGAPASLQVAASAGLTGFFYSDSQCSTASLNTSDTLSATITIPAGESAAYFYFSPDNTGSVASGILSISTCTFACGSSLGSLHADVNTQAAAPFAYTFATNAPINNQFDPGQCVAVQIAAANTAMPSPGAAILPEVDRHILVTATGGILYANSCSGNPLTGAITVPAHSAPPTVYLAVSPSSTAASIIVDDGTGSTQTFSMTLNPPTKMIWTGPTNLGTGLCFPASLKLVSADGTDYVHPSGVGLSNGISGVTFFTNPDCSVGSSVSTINVAAGSAVPYFTGPANPYYMVFASVNPTGSAGAVTADFTNAIFTQSSLMAIADTGNHLGATFHLQYFNAGVAITPAMIPTTIAASVTINGSPYVAVVCPSGSYTGCAGSNLNVTFTNGSFNSAPLYIQSSAASANDNINFVTGSVFTGTLGVLLPSTYVLLF